MVCKRKHPIIWPVLAVGNITDDKEKAEEFAQHFKFIGSNKTHSRKDVEIAKEFNTPPLRKRDT